MTEHLFPELLEDSPPASPAAEGTVARSPSPELEEPKQTRAQRMAKRAADAAVKLANEADAAKAAQTKVPKKRGRRPKATTTPSTRKRASRDEGNYRPASAVSRAATASAASKRGNLRRKPSGQAAVVPATRRLGRPEDQLVDHSGEELNGDAYVMRFRTDGHVVFENGDGL